MEKEIALNKYPVKSVLKLLLQDKTTKKNIIWATDTYASRGYRYRKFDEIEHDLINDYLVGTIQHRLHRSVEDQSARTKQKAEVFTPVWVCNRMNNFCDEEWFGRKDVFNIDNGRSWTTVKEPVTFPINKKWTDYVDSRRLEIACGEAPFLVSRYDASTGEEIPLEDRVGILDRKLRIVDENTRTEAEWLKWAVRAFQSVYGYEYQGDSLLIARVNLLVTFAEYLKRRWGRKATEEGLRQIANIIAWNLWQMDGLTDAVPAITSEEDYGQLTYVKNETEAPPKPKCRIFDWRSDRSLFYSELKRG